MTLYRGMTYAELNAAYDNRGAVPGWQGILDRWADESRRLYKDRAVHRDLAYGPHPRQRIDFFPAEGLGRPSLFYIHGGYWQWLDKSEEAFVAAGPLDRGVNVFLCGYRLCPEASFAQVVGDVGVALDWLVPRLAGYGADPARLVVGGSSAGAHLAATLLNRPAICGALLVSGLYDLEPIALSRLNGLLALDHAAARAFSPIRHIPAVGPPVGFAIGVNELPEMKRQTADYAQAWAARGLPGSSLTVPDADHFTIMDRLAAPDGALTKMLLTLCGGTARLAKIAG